MKHCFFIFALLLVLPIVCKSQAQTAIPKDWQKVDTCGATLYLPKEMLVDEGVFGMDNCAKRFVSNTLKLTVTTAAFSINPRYYVSQLSSFANKPNFKRVRTKVGGRKAVIVTYYDRDDGGGGYGFNHKLVVSIAAKGGFELSFDLKSSEDQVIAGKIIHSVVFLNSKPRF